jgi:hypothetical protein
MPVRSASLRASKFASKLDADVIRQRFSAQKDSMETQQAAKAAEAAVIEQGIKTIVEDEGVSSITIPFYIAFAKQLGKLSGKYDSKDPESTGGLEAQALADKWLARGLTNTNLVSVADFMGYTVTFA